MRVEDDVVVVVEAELAQGLQQHRHQVHQVEHRQGRQQLVERVLQTGIISTFSDCWAPNKAPHLHVFAEEEEDGDGVAEDAAAADDELQDPLQQEAQQLQQHKLLLRGLGERGHQRSQ